MLDINYARMSRAPGMLDEMPNKEGHGPCTFVCWLLQKCINRLLSWAMQIEWKHTLVPRCCWWYGRPTLVLVGMHGGVRAGVVHGCRCWWHGGATPDARRDARRSQCRPRLWPRRKSTCPLLCRRPYRATLLFVSWSRRAACSLGRAYMELEP